MGLKPTTLRLVDRVLFLLSYQGSSASRALSLQHNTTQHKIRSNPNNPCYGMLYVCLLLVHLYMLVRQNALELRTLLISELLFTTLAFCNEDTSLTVTLSSAPLASGLESFHCSQNLHTHNVKRQPYSIDHAPR